MIENLKEKKISRQNLLLEALFLILVKAKNQFQNLRLKQKRYKIRCLNVPNFCYFLKKSGLHGENEKKVLEIRNFHKK